MLDGGNWSEQERVKGPGEPGGAYSVFNIAKNGCIGDAWLCGQGCSSLFWGGVEKICCVFVEHVGWLAMGLI